MKRINFLKYQSPEEGIGPAISRTTSITPTDYVGELRVTRFKLTKGTLPIGFIYPSKRVFSEADKSAVPDMVIPTDYIIFVVTYAETVNRDIHSEREPVPHNGECYITMPYVMLGMQPNIEHYDGNFVPSKNYWSFMVQICIPGTPEWLPVVGGYKLVNNAVPFYSWADFQNKTSFNVLNFNYDPEDESSTEHVTNMVYKLDIIDKGAANPSFKLTMQAEQVDNNPQFITTPVFAFTVAAEELFNLNYGTQKELLVHVDNKFTLPDPLIGYGAATEYDLMFLLPNIKYTWGNFISRLINRTFEWPTDSLAEDLSTYYDFSCEIEGLQKITSRNYFPISHILITSDELNFKGEIMNINTRAQQGVIDPSSLTVLKSFYIGISSSSDVSDSDFIYLDDSLTNSPVIVNSPRLVNMTIRIWFITKQGLLFPLMLPGGTGFSLQLSLS